MRFRRPREPEVKIEVDVQQFQELIQQTKAAAAQLSELLDRAAEAEVSLKAERLRWEKVIKDLNTSRSRSTRK